MGAKRGLANDRFIVRRFRSIDLRGEEALSLRQRIGFRLRNQLFNLFGKSSGIQREKNSVGANRRRVDGEKPQS